jgi:precorrin-6B C5,15-methyltransferase / cobalt-precorrin-6B C5,C15-methyltransferase
MGDPVLVIGVGAEGRPACDIPTDVALVVGGRRHLAEHAPPGVPTLAIEGGLDEVLDRVAATDGGVCVLASGDPGWFGIVRRLRDRLGNDALEVHPAASSVAGAFAAVGEPWDDALVVSAHGRDVRAALATSLAHSRVAVLTSPEASPAMIARLLLDAGSGARRAVVATRLGHDDEEIHDGDLRSVARLEVADPNVLLLFAPRPTTSRPSVVAHTPARRPWAREAAAFSHRDGQISKPVVRAVALARLAPGPGQLLWDLGCGSGSAAVEAAGLGAGVIAVDRDPAQIEHTQINARRHGVGLGTVTGEAPGVLGSLPDPDAVFVGGGGSDLPRILEVVAARCRRALVASLATVERIGPTLSLLRAAGWSADAQVLAVHDVVPLADGHRLAPHNPVALILAERP